MKFAAFAALLIFVVRILDALIFDMAMSRRRNVLAPQLLRQGFAIVIYVFFLTLASNKWLGFSIYGLE